MIKNCVLVVVLLSSYAQCTETESGLRIIGGSDARAGQYPFAAAITKSTSIGNYFCTGTLHKNKYVITSAQCVVDATLFTIRLGSNSLSSNDENVIKLSTDMYFVHPEFNRTSLENDIGIIEFRMTITYTDYIRPIGLFTTVDIPASTAVVTLGWGQISDDAAGLVDKLKYVHLVTLSNEECKLIYGSRITDNMVCVEGNYNQGICKGDLGSPLILEADIFVHLAGIASFISSNGCESTDPSGFTRITPYMSWIRNVTTST